jgi:molecular chaperone GrpE
MENQEKPNGNREQYIESDELNKETASNLQAEQPDPAENCDLSDNVSDEKNDVQKKYEELTHSHLRLMAEFDNYRKRTLKEKSELVRYAGENIFTNLLPVIDDLERAVQNMRTTEDMQAIEKGVELIFGKFLSFLSQQGVKPIEAKGQPFDTETFDAIATIPAPDEELKGKVIDCVQTGYMLYDKVIRHAKVVVGE